jgi:hypothetical protein
MGWRRKGNLPDAPKNYQDTFRRGATVLPGLNPLGRLSGPKLSLVAVDGVAGVV